MNRFLHCLTFIVLTMLFAGTIARAQNRTCGTTHYMQQQDSLHPELKIKRERFEQTLQSSPVHASKGTAATYTIPVVVHVVYNTGVQNISDAQIQSQIDALNRDYQLQNADTSLIPAAFKSLKADFSIQFCLAKRDPNNNPTTGITRTATSVPGFIDNDSVKYTSRGGKDAWDRNRYLNLWVCPMRNLLLGYAQFPGGPAVTDGVVIQYNAFGTTGTLQPSFNRGRTATHEIGHWLCLYHVFEQYSCASSGDLVNDTPPQSAENYGCPSSANHCAQPNGDMYMNYMDYVNDACMFMFSAGQKQRAISWLTGDPTRNVLYTSNACTPLPPANDAAATATTLTVDAGCTGAAYTNVAATQSAGELFPSCSASSGTHTVWFKFVAPANGAVRVSTDVGSGNTLSDTHLALYSTTNVNNYPSFTSITCDGDGGSSVGTNLSVAYATGLTSGQTYYVAIDGAAGATGTFCLQVDQLAATMLSTNSCGGSYQQPGGSTSYNGWLSLLDNTSKLVAMVRNTSGTPASGFSVAQNINTGALRSGINGLYYLDRNFMISNGSAGNTDVQLFFTNAEHNAMMAGTNGATLSLLKIARQPGNTCNADYNTNNGAVTTINQSSSGTTNNFSWIQFTTSGFSNFYITGGASPLPVQFGDIAAINDGAFNKISWNSISEKGTIDYDIERSIDGKSFVNIGKQTAAQKPTEYSFLDRSPVIGNNYYRVGIVEKNSSPTYSKVVQAKYAEGRTTISLSPNPVTDILNITTSEAHGRIIMYDMMGRILKQLEVDSRQTYVDMHKMAPGYYTIKWLHGDQQQILRLSKF